ncbi:hypothetical protein [Catellatospora sp. NPDC049133]|uniref:hypothetical protein n=1 Tax=Catellatospora sp. NPDC049133 TaxID=3155499 RepID=UPI0033E20103
MGVEERIERLCRRNATGELRAFVARAGAGPALEHVLDAIRAGADSATIEAGLDVLEEAMVDAGLDGLTDSVRAFVPPIPTSGHAIIFTWVCPQRSCSRVEIATTGAETAPACAISGQPLEQLQLRA